MQVGNKELIEYRRKYQNKWVALDVETKTVLVSDADLKSVVKKVEDMKRPYVLEKVMPLNVAFIPLSL